MTTAPKKTARPASKPAARKAATAPAKPAASARAGKSPATVGPVLSFQVSKTLRARIVAVLAAIEAAPDDGGHGDALADLVADLTQAGMDYYYLEALRRAKVGFVGEQSARLGLSGAAGIISSVSRKFIVRMDKAQLLIVARHIRELG
jgi:hypothetical protein